MKQKKFPNKEDANWYKIFQVHVREFNRLLGIEGTDEQKVLYADFYQQLQIRINEIRTIFYYFTTEGREKARKYFNPEEISNNFLGRIDACAKKEMFIKL